MNESKRKIKDIVASIRARLLNIAKQTGRNYDAVLLQYFQERFLYRLSVSAYRNQFVLKGALVFLTDGISPFRPTKDIDLSGRFASKELKKIMSEICTIHHDDGVQFDTSQMSIADIALENEYNGFRIKIPAQMGVIKKKLQIDIGIGDVIYPKPVFNQFPGLLDLPAPNILFYPKEAIITEKFEAIVRFNRLTSRMKDFYDILFLAKTNYFQLNELWKAVKNTFDNRKTDMKASEIIFNMSFRNDHLKQDQWTSFLNRNSLTSTTSFADIICALIEFIEPVIDETKINNDLVWHPQNWKWEVGQ